MSTNATASESRRKAAADVVIQSYASKHESAIQRMAACVAECRATERRAMVAEAAYFRAERRGFVPGHELEDWLAAESEVADMQQHDAIVTFLD